MMIDIGNITGGEIGISFTVALWQLGVLLLLGVLVGAAYNYWIVTSHSNGRYTPTWQLVVIGVAMGLILLAFIAWPIACLVLIVYAGLGVPLAWGDAARERQAARDYAKHLRRKNKIMKRAGEVDQE